MTNQALARRNEEMENFCVKRVMVKTHIQHTFHHPLARRLFEEFCEKGSLKWACVLRKEILTKNDLKLSLMFARKVFCKISANFCEEVAGFYLDRASFPHKMNPFDKARAPRAMAVENLDKDFCFT